MGYCIYLAFLEVEYYISVYCKSKWNKARNFTTVHNKYVKFIKRWSWLTADWILLNWLIYFFFIWKQPKQTEVGVFFQIQNIDIYDRQVLYETLTVIKSCRKKPKIQQRKAIWSFHGNRERLYRFTLKKSCSVLSQFYLLIDGTGYL